MSWERKKVENKDNNLEGQRGKGGQEFPISPKQMTSMTPIFCLFRFTPLGPIQTSLQRVKHAHTNKHKSQILKCSLCKFIFHFHISILELYEQTKREENMHCSLIKVPLMCFNSRKWRRLSNDIIKSTLALGMHVYACGGQLLHGCTQ